MNSTRHWLDVPIAQNPAPPLPSTLPGEDRTLGSGLFVDLVPSSCWFVDARSCLSDRDGQRVRVMVLDRAAHRCEVCGAPRDERVRRRLEVHERWTFDDAARVQALRRLICLCSDCHAATHFGLAGVRGLAPAARAHLVAVTGMTEDQAARHVAEAYATWHERSASTWTLDLSLLTGVGVAVPPQDGAARVAAAAAGHAGDRLGTPRSAKSRAAVAACLRAHRIDAPPQPSPS